MTLAVWWIHFGLSSVTTETERVNVYLYEIVFLCSAWAVNVHRSLFEGCIASPILSCFFKQVSWATISSSYKCSLWFPDNTCGQLCKSNTSTLSPNSSWCTVAIDWTMYWCLCPFLGWLHNRGEGKPCVSIQVEFYEYLVSRWDPEHLPLHIHTHTEHPHAPWHPPYTPGPPVSVAVSHKWRPTVWFRNFIT